MSFIRNAKVRVKLLILAIATFTLVIIVDVVAIISINNFSEQVEHLHSHDIVLLSIVGEMRESFHSTRANIMNVILAEDEQSRREFIEGQYSLKESLASFSNSLDSYKSHADLFGYTSQDEAGILQSLFSAANLTENIVNQIISMDNQEEALSLVRNEFDDIIYNQILPNLHRLNSIHLESSSEQAVLAERERFLTITLMISLTLFNIAVFSLLSYILIRSITKPLHEMIYTAEHISNGKFNINIGYHSKDEVGILANWFRDIISTLEHLSKCVLEMGKEHNDGEWDFRIDSTSLKGAYKEIVDNTNQNMDVAIGMIQDIIGNMNDLANGKFDTKIKDYSGKKQKVADTMKTLRNELQTVSYEVDYIAKSGSAGILSHKIDTSRFRGDWNKVMRSLNSFTEAVAKPIEEISFALTELSNGNLSVHIDNSYEGSFAKIQKTLNQTANNLSNYISDINETVKQLANNNLNVYIKREYVGDFITIKESLNSLTDKLNETLMEILNSADLVLTGSKQVATSSVSLSQGVSQQVDAIDSALAEIDICAKQTKQDGENAEAVNFISSKSRDDINTSNQEMQNMLRAMDGIREASFNISNIIKVIEGIAFKTNILALNAAVEAARAGQHGKGFTVVADEVRDLATRSQRAASQTTELIDDTIQKVDTGTKLANSTANSLSGMVEGIHSIFDLTKLIESSGAIQAKAFAEASKKLDEISQIVKDTSAISQENAAASEEMSAQAERLQELINAFSFRH